MSLSIFGWIGLIACALAEEPAEADVPLTPLEQGRQYLAEKNLPLAKAAFEDCLSSANPKSLTFSDLLRIDASFLKGD